MKTLVEQIVARLTPYYPPEEAQELAYWVIQETTGMSRFDVRTHKGTKNIPNLDFVLQKLCEYIPVQYIFGHTEWLGMDLKVSPATLIPRPETAELVEHVSRAMAGRTGRLLDIGTGSGCIALALKQRHADWEIDGLDNSREALAVAETNARKLGLDVRFLQADILTTDVQPYDIIVSNPPYIRPSERSTMTENTLRHEPQEALFVPQDDPLLFYRRIAELHRAPELWFEISETQGEALTALMQQTGYEALCLQDIYGKQRFIHATDCR